MDDLDLRVDWGSPEGDRQGEVTVGHWDGWNKRGARYKQAPKEKRTADGRVFHSIKEKDRYLELKLLEQAGEIRDLKCQPRLPLTVDDELVCTYVADFEYWEMVGPKRTMWRVGDPEPRGVHVVEDVKGHRTALYKIKKRLFEITYGMEIRET